MCLVLGPSGFGWLQPNFGGWILMFGWEGWVQSSFFVWLKGWEGLVRCHFNDVSGESHQSVVGSTCHIFFFLFPSLSLILFLLWAGGCSALPLLPSAWATVAAGTQTTVDGVKVGRPRPLDLVGWGELYSLLGSIRYTWIFIQTRVHLGDWVQPIPTFSNPLSKHMVLYSPWQYP